MNTVGPYFIVPNFTHDGLSGERLHSETHDITSENKRLSTLDDIITAEEGNPVESRAATKFGHPARTRRHVRS